MQVFPSLQSQRSVLAAGSIVPVHRETGRLLGQQTIRNRPRNAVTLAPPTSCNWARRAPMEASALRTPVAVGRVSISSPLLRLRSDDQLVAMFRSGSEEAF